MEQNPFSEANFRSNTYKFNTFHATGRLHIEGFELMKAIATYCLHFVHFYIVCAFMAILKTCMHFSSHPCV